MTGRVYICVVGIFFVSLRRRENEFSKTCQIQYCFISQVGLMPY